MILNSFSDTAEDHALAESLTHKHGIKARYICADMRVGAACRQLIAEAGGCDVLVNNAGVQHGAPIDQFPSEKWDEILAINLTALFHTTAAALPLMRAAGWGRVVNISSAHGTTASVFKSAYVAAKHGVVGLTKTVALETAAKAITVNAICPGYTLTPLLEDQLPATMQKYEMSRQEVIENVILARQPSGAFITSEQLACTCQFLCSPVADQITGTTIHIDGGWTAQ